MTLAELKEQIYRFAEERAGVAPEKRLQLANDMADAMLYFVRVSERFGVDLIDASQQRLESEAQSHPLLVLRGGVKASDKGSC